MDIQQVCVKTGLEEWDVQNFVNQGLVSPKETGQFSGEEVQHIEQILLLRRLLLRFEDICHVLQHPEEINRLLAAHLESLRRDHHAPDAVLPVVDVLRRRRYTDLEEFFDHLMPYADDLAEVDIHYELPPVYLLNQPPLPTVVSEEMTRSEQKGKKLLIAIMAYLILNEVVSFFSILSSDHLFAALLGGIIGVAVAAVMLYFFWRGVVWLRYFYAVIYALNAARALLLLLLMPSNLIALPIYVISAGLSLTISLLLLCNQSVRDFLYSQRYY